jgi:hypothetical protein
MKDNMNQILTMEEVASMVRLNTIDDCKKYLGVMLDFYFDVMKSPQCQKIENPLDDDRNIWLQTIFTKVNTFKNLLDGFGYSKDDTRLNLVLDTSVLFSIARCVYESLIVFELLFILPKTDDQRTILYNLFMAQGLKERLRSVDDSVKEKYHERVEQEEADIDQCRKEIEHTKLYKTLDRNVVSIINDAFGKRFRYRFNGDKLERVDYGNAYKLLGVKENVFFGTYSFQSLQCHPSYLYLIQFHDAYRENVREDIQMAKTATQFILAYMSFYIVDYMKLNTAVKELYDNLDETRRFAIGMFEDAIRKEGKFK